MIATIILLSLELISLGIYLVKHGEPRTDEYNFWYKLISFIIVIVLLYFAGIFNNFVR